MRALSLWLLVAVVTYSNGAIMDLDTENKKIANAVCFNDVNAQTLELDFFVSFNGNQVDKVVAVNGDEFIRNADNTTNEAACTMSYNPNENVAFTSRVSLSGNNDYNTCGARRIGSSNDFIWVVEVRAAFLLDVYVEIDRRYFVRCIYDSAVSKFAVAKMNVFGQDQSATSEKLSPVNTMSVLRQLVPNGPFTTSSIVDLNQMVKLQIGSTVTDMETPLDPYGVYAFTCDFGPLDRTQRTVFINGNGCPNETNAFGLTRGFRFNTFLAGTSQTRIFTTETETFVMASPYPANNFYYIGCYLGYCYGSSGSDTRCTDFCTHNTGRRKRQTNLADFDRITIAIRLNEPSTVDTSTRTPDITTTEVPTTEKTGQLALIIGSAVASVIFLIILFIVVFMLCCRQGCCHGDADDRLWESSSGSSAPTSKRVHGIYDQGPPTVLQQKA